MGSSSPVREHQSVRLTGGLEQRPLSNVQEKAKLSIFWLIFAQVFTFGRELWVISWNIMKMELHHCASVHVLVYYQVFVWPMAVAQTCDARVMLLYSTRTLLVGKVRCCNHTGRDLRSRDVKFER